MRRLAAFFRNYGDALSLTALAGALFAVATNTQTGWLFLYCAFLLAALGYHLLLGLRELRAVEVHFLNCTPPRPRVKEEGEWALRVVAPRARLRYPLVVEVPPQEGEAPSTGPRRFLQTQPDQVFRCALAWARRGPVSELRVSVQSWAPFAWFVTRRDLRVPVCWPSDSPHPDTGYEVLVLPDGPSLQLSLEPGPGGREGTSSFALTRRAGHWGDLRRLRDYVPGDDPRWVHWASTARLGRLVVREQTRQSTQSLMLALDSALPQASTPDHAEQMVSWAASVLHWAPRHGYEVDLWLHGGPVPGDPLEALARWQPAASEGQPALRAARSERGLCLWMTLQPEAPPPWEGCLVVRFPPSSDHPPEAIFRQAFRQHARQRRAP